MTNELLISQIRVKEFLKQQNLRVSHGFYESLDIEIKELLLKVAKRVKASKRSTVMSYDA